MNRIYIGFDPREDVGFNVAAWSTQHHLSKIIPIYGVLLRALQRQGLYTRPTELRDGRLFDVISDHPMSTEFAISRFFVPYLSKTGWALFMDTDVLVLDDLNKLFELADPRYAVMCVQHDVQPTGTTKMDDQVQSSYYRKYWSSVMLFNNEHSANKRLTLSLLNTATGRFLHSFGWLEDHEIGALDPAYNYLVGYSSGVSDPKIIHYTDGTPDMPGYECCEYADKWWEARRRFTSCPAPSFPVEVAK